MNYFEYIDSPYTIRDEIKRAHRLYWSRLAIAGSWWTGAERVDIAAECRAAVTCGFCAERKRALTPYIDEYKHESGTSLSDQTVDAVHRIVTDQTRITRNWIDSNEKLGLSVESYVELSGIVVAVLSIDEFHRSLGIPYEQLPEPQAGEPDHYRPSNLSSDTGFVPMILRDGAVGNEEDLWAKDFSANVLRALSLVPDAVRSWKDLASAQYLSIEDMGNFVGQADRAIDRAQMEIVAGRVSSQNECFY